MKSTMKRLMSLALLVSMMLGLVPEKVQAEDYTTDLVLGEEVEFELTDKDDTHTFSYTAEEEGTYIIYFRDLSGNSISLAFSGGAQQYNNFGTRFQGHAIHLRPGQSFYLTFGVPEGEEPYSGTVGAALPAEYLDDFFSQSSFNEEAPNISKPVQNERMRLTFCASNSLAYGVEWSVTIDDEEILELDEAETKAGANMYEPCFRLKAPGQTHITIEAKYGGSSIEKNYVVEVTDGEEPEEPDEPDHPHDAFGFSDFAELKELCRTYRNENVRIGYTGDKTLVITSNLNIPESIELTMNGKDMRVAEGAKLTLNNYADVYNLQVEGTLNANRHLHVENNLLVSGNLETSDSLYVVNKLSITGTAKMLGSDWTVRYPGTIEGIDNIDFVEEHKKIEIDVWYEDSAELKARTEAISEEFIDHERCKYRLSYHTEDYDNRPSEFKITDDITIPTNVYISLADTDKYTIAEGKTLTNEGELNIHRPLTVNGTLNNNGITVIFNTEEESGMLIVPDTGKYKGTGDLRVLADENEEIEDLLQVDISDDFDIREHFHGDGNREWEFIYAAHLIKLATPINPIWGIKWNEQWEWNEETGEDVYIGVTAEDRPGMISWETDRPDQAEAEIKIYRKGESAPVSEHYYGFGVENIPPYRSIEAFMESDLDSGTYYFTVRSVGDYKTYRSSDIAVSGEYTYVKPEKQLGKCTNLRWQDRNDGYIAHAVWDAPADVTYLDGYHVSYYFSETRDGEYEEIGGVGGRGADFPTDVELPDHFVQERGAGYYKFKVRAYSRDVEQCLNAEFTGFSPVLDLKTVPTQTTLDLEKMAKDAKDHSFSPTDIKNTVQQIDKDDLKLTLLADQDNSGATDKLAELEDMAGGAADVVVTKNAYAFDERKVSIVGANLNTNKEEDESVTLIIDKPEEDHVIPERYDSSVAIRFSMTLDNVEDPSNLQVPVKITLPVPRSINPQFLVIFHYHADGTHEVIRPYVYKVKGQYYADIVLTSFSDFIMTQEISAGSGTGSGSGSGSGSSAQPEEGKAVGNVPLTGDLNMVAPCMIACIVSGCGMLYFFTKKRYNKQ